MPRVDASDCVVFVIDTQPGFYRGRDDVDRSSFAGFVARVAWVVGIARALGVPIVETVERPERNGDTAPEVRDALPPDGSRFEKDRFSVAGNEQVSAHLAELGRRTAVLVGMETDVCIAQSAFGLADLGMRVIAVRDALFAPGVAHEHGLERLRQAGAELVSAKILFYEWLPSVTEVRTFKKAHPVLGKPPGFDL